jgi:Rrf2 family protein
MNLSRKCQYALRALLELAKQREAGPVASRQIALIQKISPNFLELILKELRQAGWVTSSRGPAGGYVLAVSPESLSVGAVIRFIEGPFSPVKCATDNGGRHCTDKALCAFAGLWARAERRLADLYDNTTFREILDEQEALLAPLPPSYCI